MAGLSTNFKSTQDLKVVVHPESTFGAGDEHSSGAYHLLPIIAPPTFKDLGAVALDVGSQQTGTYIPNHNQMKQRLDSPMWEIQLQYLGVDMSKTKGWGLGQLCDDNSVPLTLDCDYDASNQDWNNDGATTIGVADSLGIWIGGATGMTSNRDVRFKGCVCKSVDISHSIDSNGGFPVVTATFVTGFKSTGVDTISDGTITPADYTGTEAVHWTELDVMCGKYLGLTAGSSDYDVRAYGYNLSISRDIQRVGYKDTTNYFPYSYEMVGGYTITGDITFKKDTQINNIDAFFRDGVMSGFYVGNGSTYDVGMSGIVSDVSTDTGSPELRNTVSFQGAGNLKTTGTITAVADGSTPSTIGYDSVGHGLSVGQRVTITGCTDTGYNGTFYVEEIYNQDRFVLDPPVGFTATDTGTWTLHNDSKAIITLDF